MHSSGMRTGRALTVSGGVSAPSPGGVCFWSQGIGGVCFWSQGGLLLVPGGMSAFGLGVSAFGPGGCLLLVQGVYIKACNGADPPPCGQNDRHV